MNEALNLLASTRAARREAALARLAEARRQCDAAYADCRAAADRLQQSRRWHADVSGRCALGAGQDIRESLLPACEALVQQRQQAFAATQAALRSASVRLASMRQESMVRERDLLRLEAWQFEVQSRARRVSAALEDRLDDESIPRPAGRERAA